MNTPTAPPSVCLPLEILSWKTCLNCGHRLHQSVSQPRKRQQNSVRMSKADGTATCARLKREMQKEQHIPRPRLQSAKCVGLPTAENKCPSFCTHATRKTTASTGSIHRDNGTKHCKSLPIHSCQEHDKLHAVPHEHLSSKKCLQVRSCTGTPMPGSIQ